jgi:hypothetical protein
MSQLRLVLSCGGTTGGLSGPSLLFCFQWKAPTEVKADAGFLACLVADSRVSTGPS